MTKLNFPEPSDAVAASLYSIYGIAVRRRVFVALALFALAVFAAPAAAQTYTVLYKFTNGKDGNSPGALLNANGVFYGATSAGGSANYGTIFKVTSGGAKTNVYTFQQVANGKSPNGPLVRIGANFYGTTAFGGNTSCNVEFNERGCGVVFRLSPAGEETVLHSFNGGGSDGALPFSGLAADSQGNLYGTTAAGGTGCFGSGCGTVYKITTSGVETVLYEFTGGTDGAGPESGTLIVDGQGNVYGTTPHGGNSPCLRNAQGCGVVFKVDASGHETVLHAFRGGSDGAYPSSGLVRDADGNLYGTTSEGGDIGCDASGNGCGVVFKIDPSGNETVLYSFQVTDTLGGYVSNLILDPAGNLYGATEYGGTGQDGTIFEISNGGVYSILYTLSGAANGEFPAAGLVRDQAGNLYGTTSSGGEGGCDEGLGCGVVFKLTP